MERAMRVAETSARVGFTAGLLTVGTVAITAAVAAEAVRVALTGLYELLEERSLIGRW